MRWLERISPLAGLVTMTARDCLYPEAGSSYISSLREVGSSMGQPDRRSQAAKRLVAPRRAAPRHNVGNSTFSSEHRPAIYVMAQLLKLQFRYRYIRFIKLKPNINLTD
jgi:hypothetical protein